MDAAQAYGGGVGAEFVDGRREAFGVQAGGLAVGAGLIHALAAVGDDQGDERTGSCDHPEGELHQVEERLRIELGAGVQCPEVEQHHQHGEDGARDEHGGGEGQEQRPADFPQPQLPVIWD
ncbi:hypothetical protein GCM10018987_17460 [Streptomyces cremeus]